MFVCSLNFILLGRRLAYLEFDHEYKLLLDHVGSLLCMDRYIDDIGNYINDTDNDIDGINIEIELSHH